jgi:3-oxoacyl-[acyl-carrier protein] reductase
VAVVTGASNGIGAATVRVLLDGGYHVVAFDTEPMLNTSEHLEMVQGDATREEDVERLAMHVANIGTLHVVVNVVGSVCGGRLLDLTPADWRNGFDVNLTSVFLVCRALLPILERTQGDRVIVNLSSSLARVCDPETIAYGAFKSALEHFSRTLALELAPRGVRVMVVAPGPVAGAAAEARWDEASFGHLSPLKRFATPQEVARVIGFIAAPEAAYLTGAVYAVDGGDAALGVGWGSLNELDATA